MSENAVTLAGRALQDGVGLLRAAMGCAASEEQRVAGLGVCESLARQLEQLQIELVAGLVHDGVFAARGYRSAVQAVADLLGCDTAVARRRVRVRVPRTSAPAGRWMGRCWRRGCLPPGCSRPGRSGCGMSK